MTEHRTDGVVELIEALQTRLGGWTVEWSADRDAPELVIHPPTGPPVAMEVKRRTSVTPSMATRLVHELTAPALVVADLIHSTAGDALRDAGLSFWDRRGHLVLQADDPLMRVDTRIRSHVRGADGPISDRPITGRAGIAVAVAACMWPNEPKGVREVAAIVGMSPSTVSDARARLIDHGLLSSTGEPLLPDLFWAASDVWVVDWRPTRTWPTDPGWRQAGHGAAVLYGAPTVTGVPQAYAPDRATLDRHLLRLPATDGDPTYLVAVAPTPLATAGTGVAAGATGPTVVDPIIAALDLSRDARGREILSEWHTIDPAVMPMVEPDPRREPGAVWL